MRIRTKVRNASEADLVSAREAQGIEFRPTRDELLLLARTSTDRVTEALARRWSEHPDELVAMMFVRTHLGAVASNRTLMLREIHTRISERAVRDAEQGGDDWTPLLDVLVDVAGGDGMVRQVTGYEKRLRKLHAWIRRVSDPAELVPLAQLDSSAIRYAQLEIARTIPEELLAHWIQGGGDMMRVLRNDQLARRHAPALLLHLFELGIREVLELEEDIREIEPRWLRGTDQAYADLVIDRALGVSSEDPWTASYRGVLGWVIDKLPDIDPERIRSLVADTSRDFPKSDLLASLVLHPSAPPEIRRDLLAGKFGFGANLLMHACADAEFLRAAWRRGGEKAVEMIYLHPNTPADVAVQLIASWDGWREEIGVPPLAQHAEAAVMLATAGGLRKANEVLALYAASAQLDRRRGQESVIETALSVIVAHEDVGEDVVSHIEMLASRGALRISPALYARLLSDDDQVIRERLINSLSAPSEREAEVEEGAMNAALDEAAYVAWLRTVRSADTLRDLLRLPVPRVMYLVARYVDAAVFDTDLLREQFTLYISRNALLRNPTLSPAQIEWICMFSLEQTLEGSGSLLREALTALEEVGREVPKQAMLERIRAVLASQPGGDLSRRRVGEMAADVLFLFWSDVTAEDIERAWRFSSSQTDCLIARHPRVSEALLEKIWSDAQQEREVATMRAVAEHPAARRDGELYDAVLASGQPHAIAHAMEGRPGHEIAEVLVRLASEQPRKGYDFLRTLRHEDRRRLPTEALAVLLAAEASEIRLGTQAMLSELSASRGESEQAPVALTARETLQPAKRERTRR